MGNLHEVLPGISVFSNFYYIRTKEITYLNPSIEFSVKSYISMEILRFGIKILCKTSCDQTVSTILFFIQMLRISPQYEPPIYWPLQLSPPKFLGD